MRATRMGDDLFGAFRDGIKGMAATEQYTHDTAEALFDECDRARSEEARLTEEIKKKDAQIEALVDRLADAVVELEAIADHQKNPVSTNSALFQIASNRENSMSQKIFDDLRSLVNQLADRSDRRERGRLATQTQELLAKLEAQTKDSIPRSVLLTRAKDAFKRTPSIKSAHYKAQMAIQIILNGRWGTCVECPRDLEDFFPRPENCVNADRYDHDIPPERAP